MKRKNKLLMLISLIFGIATYTWLGKKFVSQNYAKTFLEKQPPEKEHAGFAFALERLQNRHGLIHAWVEQNRNAPDILLESMGQILEYVALLKEQELFDYYRSIINDYFISPQGYYFWQLDEQTKQGKYHATAFLDDLRLARAYFILGRNDSEYTQELQTLANRIYDFNINKNCLPVDFYDENTKLQADEISLFYLDLETLGNLANLTKKWQKVFAQAQKILLDMPENQFGLYPQKYKLESNEYVWQGTVNMVENLYTAIYAQKGGRKVTKFACFLKEQISKGYIFNYYNLAGNPESMDDSAGVYALTARLFASENDPVSAKWCYDKVLSCQLDKKNKLAGGFSDGSSGQVFAFNHLEALLMFRYLELAGVKLLT